MTSGTVEEENDDDTIGSNMGIQIEASNLANMDVFSLSDPFALLETLNGDAWTEIGEFYNDGFIAASCAADAM